MRDHATLHSPLSQLSTVHICPLSLTLRSVEAVGEVEHLHARRLGRLAAGADDVARGHPPLRLVRLPEVFFGLAGQARLKEEGKHSFQIFLVLQCSGT